MSLASTSHPVVIMGAAQLFTIAQNVTRELPEAHSFTRAWRRRRFKLLVDEFVAGLYQVDTTALTDDQYAVIERATQIVSSNVEIHMLMNCDAAECQVLSESTRRLHAALEGLEQGLAIDPSKRPGREQLLNSLSDELKKLDLVQSLSPQIPLLRR